MEYEFEVRRVASGPRMADGSEAVDAVRRGEAPRPTATRAPRIESIASTWRGLAHSRAEAVEHAARMGAWKIIEGDGGAMWLMRIVRQVYSSICFFHQFD